MKHTVNAIVSQAVGKGSAVMAWAGIVSMAGKSLSSLEYGQFMQLSSLGMLVAILASFGQPQVLLFLNGKLASPIRSEKHHNNYLLCAWALFKISTLVVILAAFLVQYSSLIETSLLLNLAWAIWILGSCWQAFFAEDARTVSQMWWAGLLANSGGAGGAVALVLSIAVIYALKDWVALDLVFCSLATASVLCVAIYLGCYRAKKGDVSSPGCIHTKKVFKSATNVFSMGAFVTLGSLMTYMVGQSDLWWVTLCSGTEVAGDYGTAAYLARFCSLSSILLSSAYSARYVAMLALGDIDHLSKLVRKISLWSSIQGFFILVVLVGSHQQGWLENFFKLESTGSFGALIILGLGHVIGNIFGYGPQLLSASGRFKELLVITCFSAGITLAFGWGAVFYGGLQGLAFIFSCSYVFFTVACYRRCVHVLGIRPFSTV